MAFNPVQFGDWSTRLRRALGLRGDLGFTLAGPAAQPVVVLDDVHDLPYADVPQRWGAIWNISPVAAAYGQVVFQSLPGYIITVDKIKLLGGSTLNAFAQLIYGTAVPLAGTLVTENTNPSPEQVAAYPTAGQQVLSPVPGSYGTVAGAPPVQAYGMAGLYYDIDVPAVLWDPSWVQVTGNLANTIFYGMAQGRYWKLQK